MPLDTSELERIALAQREAHPEVSDEVQSDEAEETLIPPENEHQPAFGSLLLPGEVTRISVSAR